MLCLAPPPIPPTPPPPPLLRLKRWTKTMGPSSPWRLAPRLVSVGLVALAAAAAIMAATVATPARAQSPPNITWEIDYAIAVDESSSVTPANFEFSRAFVVALFTAATARSETARYSIVTFTIITNELVRQVDNVAATAAIFAHQKASGGTSIAAALIAATDTLIGSGAGEVLRERVIFLLTDGASNGPAATAAADVAKADGIVIVTIAVGAAVNQALLSSLASNLQLVFSVVQEDQLLGLVDNLLDKACYVVAPTPTPTPTPRITFSKPSPTPNIMFSTPMPSPTKTPRNVISTPLPNLTPRLFE